MAQPKSRQFVYDVPLDEIVWMYNVAEMSTGDIHDAIAPEHRRRRYMTYDQRSSSTSNVWQALRQAGVVMRSKKEARALRNKHREEDELWQRKNPGIPLYDYPTGPPEPYEDDDYYEYVHDDRDRLFDDLTKATSRLPIEEE